MTKIEAIVRPEKLDALQNELAAIGCRGLTVSEVRGAGQQAGYVERYRGSEYHVRLHPKVKVELVVTDAAVEAVVRAICDAAFTGEVGDGKIFLLPVTGAVRIRTGDRDEVAL